MEITQAVEAMGQQMGIGIRLDHAGVCTLNAGEDSSLFLERRKDKLAVSLARKTTGDVMPALMRGLELCHPKNSPMMGLRVGMFRGDTVVALCCLSSHHLRSGMHEQVIPYLFNLMDKIV